MPTLPAHSRRSTLAAGVGAVLLSLLGAPRAPAAPAPAAAGSLFTEAEAICRRDDGRLWGRSLCGPILLVDYTDNGVLASQADAEGRLVREVDPASGRVLFRGTLPAEVIVANTPTEWAGVRWTQLAGPLPDDTDHRHVLLAHELFHRIQPALHLDRPEQANQHLDTQEGRTLLQLEWRALARALDGPGAAARRAAIADALAFRQARYARFPEAARQERALEINEGVPEYTGVRLGVSSPRGRVAYALYDLTAFVAAPSFVRSFAYATGPSYGLLLDRAAPRWRRQLLADQGRARAQDLGLDERLARALRLDPTALVDGPEALAARAARYDADGRLRATEVGREAARQARLTAYQARLVDGPVLILPLTHSNYQFNPQTLVPLAGFGTVYPTMRLTDDWGALTVERNGALVSPTPGAGRATVSAVGMDPAGIRGDGWSLQLAPGWVVCTGGSHPGDRLVARICAVP